ncbi:MAG: hypothetical protein ACFCU4_01330 [Puniceicoccaceae bacterium]
MPRLITPSVLVLLLVSLLGGKFSSASGVLPELVEAEDHPAAESEVLQDGGASSGAYLHNPRVYHPLLIHPVPDSRDPFDLWVRVRGQAVQLKGIQAGGAQKEFNWLFDSPPQWTWLRFGSFSRSDLGEQILILSGPGAEDSRSGIDAIAFRPVGSPAPGTTNLTGAPSLETAALAGGIATKPSAQKSALTSLRIARLPEPKQSTPHQFSVAIFQGFKPEVTHDPRYQEAVAYLKSGTLRYHYAGMAGDSRKNPAALTRPDLQDWDREKLLHTMAPPLGDGARRVFNISSWPSWMDADRDGFLDSDQFDSFAEFCAEAVRILNIEGGLGIEYFEITNEKDGRYWVDLRRAGLPDRLLELADIYNRAAVAMKAVDPSIKTGGPSIMRPDYLDDIEAFAAATLPNLDFLSVHAYASGDLNESDASIYDKSRRIGQHLRDIRERLDKIDPQNSVEIHLNEYNISWTWETREPRMTNHKGAVFDALCFIEFVHAGLDVGNAWNEYDGIYGKIGHNFELRPAAHLFHLANTHMIGAVLDAQTDTEHLLEILAVEKSPNGLHLMVVNRTDFPQQLSLRQPSSFSVTQWQRIDESGLHQGSSEPSLNQASGVSLPRHSVTFFQLQSELR